MKPFEIALWKHFIIGKGMATVYINLYRQNHLKKNPISVEEFFQKTEPKDVCMTAFTFYINSNYGYDYWSRMTDLWIEFYETNKNNYTADEWYKLTGMAKILRTNWDAARHWKEEPKLIAAKRLGIDLSLLGLENKSDTIQPTKMSEEYLREKTDEEILGSGQGDVKVEKQDANGIFGEFELMSITPHKNNKRRLKDDELSLNLRGGRGRMTFNQTLSKEIKARGGYEYASLLKNKKGEVLLWLNDTDENGATIQDGSKTRENDNVCISSNTLVSKVATFLNIKADYAIIHAKELEKTSEYVAYLLTNK